MSQRDVHDNPRHCENLHLERGARQFFHPNNATCCEGHLTFGLNQNASQCCGDQAYNPLNEHCCNGTVHIKPKARVDCCGSELWDTHTQLCCGKEGKLLNRKNEHSKCCGVIRFDIRNETCNHTLDVVPWPCGTESWDAEKQLCCGPEKKILNKTNDQNLCCSYDQYDPKKECCTDNLKVVSLHDCKPKIQSTAVNDVSRNTKLTQGDHVCEEDNNYPQSETCCNGHKHKAIRTTCCGTKVYNYSDLQLKCCHGILYNLTLLGWNPLKAQCCGSLLLKERSNSTQECCISSQGRSLAYKAQPGLSCCGHHYYNTSLWLCFSESLFPLSVWSRQTSGVKTGANNHTGSKLTGIQLVRLVDFPCLELCGKVFLGIVKSAKDNNRCVEMVNMLQIYWMGKARVMTTSPPVHFCLSDSSRLLIGKMYMWSQNKTFSELNDLSSIHFIFSRCNDKH
ncbi:galaxin isoform X1 [Osmerus eperlanus]|uniref:galaxin isoform X1 n=1 Tax=Osmerus eperlanus TaxID=29151 RepID=UPI002E0D3AC0